MLSSYRSEATPKKSSPRKTVNLTNDTDFDDLHERKPTIGENQETKSDMEVINKKIEVKNPKFMNSVLNRMGRFVKRKTSQL